MDANIHPTSRRVSIRRRAPGTALVKGSYRYRWDDLEFESFPLLGVVARRAPNGAPCFNFPQTIWLFPDVKMDWAPEKPRAVLTLSINILTSFLPKRDLNTCFGTANRRALHGAKRFAETFLLSMPEAGGCIPREVIQAWIHKAL